MPPKRINSPPSLSSSGKETFLFCGSGDRWISVWKSTTTNDDNRIPNARNPTQDFEFVQKLGPHTGWVKDLVYDDRSRLLHSIGCNCIETWDCRGAGKDQDSNTPLPISHSAKRVIENSPTMGITLSSDLLCLCLISSTTEDGDELPRLLVSGGVDGRIHLWLSDPNADNTSSITNLDGRIPVHTALAHGGRVNTIVYSSATNAIFTAGNDGFLCAFRVSLEHGFELFSKLKLEEASNETSLRLTVASITRDLEGQGRCSLALGSSKGELYFVTAETKTEGGIACRIDGDYVSVAENSMIYSIASAEDSDLPSSSRLWVGHASGLATLDNYF